MKKTKKISSLLLLPALMLLIGVAAMPTYARQRAQKKEVWEKRSSQRKADYIYLEAARQSALNNDNAHFEFLRHSLRLDTTDTYPGMSLGYYYLVLGQGDAVLPAKGYGMMKRHFDANPDDYYSAILYGGLNSQLGNVEEAVRVWHVLDSLNPHKPNVNLRYAQALMASQAPDNLREAIIVLNRIERAEGRDIGLTSHKVRAFMALGDTLSVMNEVDSLLNNGSVTAANAIFAGDVFNAMDKRDKSIRYYDLACRLDSTNGLAFYRRAEFYREEGDTLAYENQVLEALRQDGLEIKDKIEIFSDYIRQNINDSISHPKIEGIFSDILVSYPLDVDVRDLYSSYFYTLGEYSKAAEQSEVSLDLDPSNPSRWMQVMSLYGRVYNYEKVAEIGLRGMEYLPDDIDIAFYLAVAFANLKRDDEAAKYYEIAIEKCDAGNKERLSDLHASYGDLLINMGRTDEGYAEYDKAIEANPENYMVLNNYAYFLAEAGSNLDNAEKMSAMSVRAQPDNPTFIDTYAWIYFKKKDFEHAREWIDRAVTLTDAMPEPDILHHAGDIYYMLGEPAKALEFWKDALDLDPNNALLRKKVKNKTHYYE